MLKNQKSFSPLECQLCKQWPDCVYGQNYEEMYRYGYKMQIALCKRLNPAQSKNA